MERTSKTSSSHPPPLPEQEQPPPPSGDEGFKVHYVVPAGPSDQAGRDSSNDFKEIYISTPNSGLQRVELGRNGSSASSSVAASSKSSSPCANRDAASVPRKAVSTISETVPEELSAIAAARSLGAVPKKKRSLASSPSSGSSASSSAASESTAPSR